ncbi:MAG: lipopolysaccharide biosynthesis protein [Eggerthellaceae bacterium]|nr:lipopolysaccharide biosynthesis protein [Eggerthellaceae bacterium]
MYERPDTNKDGEGKQSGNPRRALRGREGVRTRRRSVRKDELQASHVDRSAKAEPSSPGRRRQRAQEGDARAAITGRIGVSDHPREHKQNFIARMANQWFDRVMGAMRGDGLSAAEAAYAPHRTTRDFIFNTAGAASWAMVFPVVTMVSTQLVGVEQAGMISMAFVVALLLMFIGNFGVRTYQVSDMDEHHSFKDYQVNRWITCLAMVLVGWIYCSCRGYASEMFQISMAVIAYRCVDALADVYEGRLQQVDKLYLAGISQTIRSLLALVVFCIVLALSRNSVAACTAMFIAALATFIVITWPLTLLETPRSRGFSMRSLMELFKMCAPLFVAIFLFNVIENMPKLVMEGMLPYDNQLYYNALYFPAQMILIAAQLVYKPLLLRMAGVWQDASKRLKFDLILGGIVLVIVAITAITWLIMAWVGVPVMSFLYGIDFEEYRSLLYLMLVTGGITALIDFLYQVITIMRRQKDVTVLYCISFFFSLFIPILLIGYTELEGAILSYLIIESILCVLLVWEYFRIRQGLSSERKRGGSASGNASADDASDPGEHARTTFIPLIDPADPEISEAEGYEGAVEEEEPRPLRPSEKRAIREHREEVMRRRTGKSK